MTVTVGPRAPSVWTGVFGADEKQAALLTLVHNWHETQLPIRSQQPGLSELPRSILLQSSGDPSAWLSAIHSIALLAPAALSPTGLTSHLSCLTVRPPCRPSHNRLHLQTVSQTTPLSLNCLRQSNEKSNQHAPLDTRKITLKCLSRAACSTRAQGAPRQPATVCLFWSRATELQVATLPTWEPGCVILFYLTSAVALNILKNKFQFLGLHTPVGGSRLARPAAALSGLLAASRRPEG